MENFDRYVCAGDFIEFEYKGITFTAKVEHDIDYHIDDDDCHNTDQSVTGCNDEQYERLLKNRRAWFNNEWFYCGVVLYKQCDCCNQVIASPVGSLWGLEVNYPGSDDNRHLSDTALELAQEYVDSIDRAA